MLPVVLFHADVPGFAGGFVGVDVFFVISGFLITSIVARELNEGRFSIRGFYLRRIRRLFPALFCVVLVSAGFAYWLLMPQELEDFGESVIATSLFGSNFLFNNEAGYFDGPAEMKPLLHTWSLAIEEQYYVLYPALLLWLAGTTSRPLFAATVSIGVVSFAIAQWAVTAYPGAAFYLLPSRAWELMLGSGLALAVLGGRFKKTPRTGREVAGVVGLGLIAIAVFTYDETTPFPGAAALLPCVGTALLIYAGTAGSYVVGHLLSLRALVFFGLLSYSLYLWHWPVIVFLKHYLLTPLNATAIGFAIALSFVLAYLSWRYVERPFRKSSGQMFSAGWGWLQLEDKHLFRATGMVMLLSIGIGLYLDQSDGVPDRLRGEAAEIYAVAEDKAPERKRCEGIAPEQISYERLCRLVDNSAEPTFLVWGDSHAVAMMHVMAQAAEALEINGLNATSNGCVPLLNLTRPGRDLDATCIKFAQQVMDILADHPRLETIVLISRWARHAEGSAYGQEGKPTLFLRHADGRRARNVAENRVLFEAGLRATVHRLQDLGRRVVVVGPVPEMGIDVPAAMAKARMRGREFWPAVERQAFFTRQAFVLEQLQASDAGYEFVPIHDYFCSSQKCPGHDGRLPIYFDDNHPALRGTQRLGELFRSILQRDRAT